LESMSAKCQKRTFDETQFAFSSGSFCQLQSSAPGLGQ
jgi:hypothetical protein